MDIHTARCLDLENVVRIAYMFIDGDKLDCVLKDPYSIHFGMNDYVIDNFNHLKMGLLHIEQINPDMRLVALLWKVRPDNKKIMYVAAAGTTYGYEGVMPLHTTPEVYRAIVKGECSVKNRDDGAVSYYYPVKNSNEEIIGALELISGHMLLNS